MQISRDSVYFISYKDGWWVVTPTIDRKKVLCRASTLVAATNWVFSRHAESKR